MRKDNKPNGRRRLVLKSIGAAGIMGLAGCSEGETTPTNGGGASPGSPNSGDWPDLSGQNVHMLIDETGQPFRDLFNKMAADFTQATGAQVNNEFAGYAGGIRQRLAQLIQAGSPPDIVFQSGAETTNLANQGILAPVDEAVEYWAEQWGPAPEEFRIRFDGNDWLLPISSKGNVLWYREDLFENSPSSWSSMLDICADADGKENLAAHVLPLDQASVCPEYSLMGHVYSNNVNLAERRNGELQIGWDRGQNGSRMIEVLEYLQELHQYSHTGGDVGCTAMNAGIAVNRGQSTMSPVSRPKNTAIDQDHPHAGDVRGVVTPSPDGNGPTYGNSEGFNLIKTDSMEAGMEWLKFLSQLDYLMPLFSITPYQIQPINPQIKDSDEWTEFESSLPDAWTEADKEVCKHRNYKILANETDPPNPYAASLFESQPVQHLCYDVLENGRDPEPALQDHADELREILSSAKSE